LNGFLLVNKQYSMRQFFALLFTLFFLSTNAQMRSSELALAKLPETFSKKEQGKSVVAEKGITPAASFASSSSSIQRIES
jgi:hypothetical protein